MVRHIASAESSTLSCLFMWLVVIKYHLKCHGSAMENSWNLICKNIQDEKNCLLLNWLCSSLLSFMPTWRTVQVKSVFSWLCQLSWVNKVHFWHISTTPCPWHTWEDTSGSLSSVSAEQRGGLVTDGFPDHPSHWCTAPHSEAWGGSCISLCRYADAWETAATGWGDKTAHLILWTSDSAASSTESGSTGPYWNWITWRQEGVGTRLSEQSQMTTGSRL